MRIQHVLILLLAPLAMSFVSQKALSKKLDKQIKETYNVEKYSYSFTAIPKDVITELHVNFSDNNLLSIKANDTLKGYAYLGKAPSKTAEFDYLVLLDTDLVILKSKVLVYREEYGGEIGSKRWLKQFIGKTQNDDLKYGDDIMAISGATI